VVRLLMEEGAVVQIQAKVSAIPVVHVGCVAFLPTIPNLLFPCLTTSSVSDTEWGNAAILCQGRRHQRGVSAV
jgi:hypothetical protein